MLPVLQKEEGGLDMSIRVILELKAKPGTGDELVAFFGSILPETRAYEGVQVSTRCRTARMPTMLW